MAMAQTISHSEPMEEEDQHSAVNLLPVISPSAVRLHVELLEGGAV